MKNECGGYTTFEAKCTESKVCETANGDVYELASFHFPKLKYDSQPYYFSLKEDHSYRFRQADIPFEYMGRTLQDFHWDMYHDSTTMQRKLVNAFVSKWEQVKDHNHGLYIYSDTWGSGKTLLACCIGNELIQRYGTVVRFVNIAEYLDLCRERGDAYKKLFDCDLLIIDDMGAEDTSKQYVEEMVYKLVNARYANHKINIYTSNFPCDSDRYAGRIRSRLMHNYPLVMPEESIRKQLAEQENETFIRDLLKGEG